MSRGTQVLMWRLELSDDVVQHVAMFFPSHAVGPFKVNPHLPLPNSASLFHLSFMYRVLLLLALDIAAYNVEMELNGVIVKVFLDEEEFRFNC